MIYRESRGVHKPHYAPWVRSILQQEAYDVCVALPTSDVERGFVAPVPSVYMGLIAQQHPRDILAPRVRCHLYVVILVDVSVKPSRRGVFVSRNYCCTVCICRSTF